MNRIPISEHLVGRENGGEVIAAFGQAKLVKSTEGKLELRGGSKEDRLNAKEWISLFMHEALIKEV